MAFPFGVKVERRVEQQQVDGEIKVTEEEIWFQLMIRCWRTEVIPTVQEDADRKTLDM